MTRRDYVIIARGINEGLLNAEAIYKENLGPALEILSAIKDELTKDNAKFDELKFVRACVAGTQIGEFYE